MEDNQKILYLDMPTRRILLACIMSMLQLAILFCFFSIVCAEPVEKEVSTSVAPIIDDLLIKP